VTKAGELPDWVKTKTRIRIIQPSRGFYRNAEERNALEALGSEDQVSSETEREGTKSTRAEITIGERIEKWRRMALLRIDGEYRTVTLPRPFFEILAEIIYPIARSYRYLGNWVIRFDQISDLLDWEMIT